VGGNSKVTIAFDEKGQMIVLVGLSKKVMKEIQKKMQKNKEVILQTFAEGFTVTPHGIAVSEPVDEHMVAYA